MLSLFKKKEKIDNINHLDKETQEEKEIKLEMGFPHVIYYINLEDKEVQKENEIRLENGITTS